MSLFRVLDMSNPTSLWVPNRCQFLYPGAKWVGWSSKNCTLEVETGSNPKGLGVNGALKDANT